MNTFLHNVIGVNEAASILNVSHGYIKNLCARGKIVAKKVGKTWVIDRSRLKGVSQMCEVRTDTRYFNCTKCLVCDHQDKVYHPSKEEYQEVTVCPKCNGAFVDVWKLEKYKQHIVQYKECQHKYQSLGSETTSFYADGGQTIQEVSATFYCEKCLDIQYQKKRIEKWG
nr:helix-turn-helix domain-containing protein [Bacillus thuringiensis]